MLRAGTARKGQRKAFKEAQARQVAGGEGEGNGAPFGMLEDIKVRTVAELIQKVAMQGRTQS